MKSDGSHRARHLEDRSRVAGFRRLVDRPESRRRENGRAVKPDQGPLRQAILHFARRCRAASRSHFMSPSLSSVLQFRIFVSCFGEERRAQGLQRGDSSPVSSGGPRQTQSPFSRTTSSLAARHWLKPGFGCIATDCCDRDALSDLRVRRCLLADAPGPRGPERLLRGEGFARAVVSLVAGNPDARCANTVLGKAEKRSQISATRIPNTQRVMRPPFTSPRRVDSAACQAGERNAPSIAPLK